MPFVDTRSPYTNQRRYLVDFLARPVTFLVEFSLEDLDLTLIQPAILCSPVVEFYLVSWDDSPFLAYQVRELPCTRFADGLSTRVQQAIVNHLRFILFRAQLQLTAKVLVIF